MIKFVPAKINIGLNITERRPDGYHNLETLFYPIGAHNGTPECPYPFGDVLEIYHDENSDSTLTFNESGPYATHCDMEKNLVVKAFRTYAACVAAKTCRELKHFIVNLEKHIPSGAGLGGGSADATYTLRLLNELCDNTLTHEELHRIATSLGADCPFFLYDEPMMGEGIGEVLRPCEIDLSGKWLVVVKPDIFISTKEAFSRIRPRHPETPLIEALKRPMKEWRHCVVNDFEPSLHDRYPILAAIKQSLYDNDAIYASLSGSGAALYGIYDDRETADKARKALTYHYSDLYSTLIVL